MSGLSPPRLEPHTVVLINQSIDQERKHTAVDPYADLGTSPQQQHDKATKRRIKQEHSTEGSEDIEPHDIASLMNPQQIAKFADMLVALMRSKESKDGE